MKFVKNVQWRSEKFGAVIFDTLNEKVYVTNDTGDDILRLVADGLDVRALTERLQEEYLGDEAEIDAAVAEFVSELQSAGLLAGEGEGGA